MFWFHETYIEPVKGPDYGEALEIDSSYQVRKQILPDGTQILFAYDDSGNLIKVTKGKAVTQFAYDALDRLTGVVTADGNELQYVYAPGEPSLVTQADIKTLEVPSTRMDSGWTFSPEAEFFALRTVSSPFGSVRFSPNLGRYQLSGADGTEIAAVAQDPSAPLKALQLLRAGTPPAQRLGNFVSPTNNAFFLPPEFATINCCLECSFGNGFDNGVPCGCDLPGPPPQPVTVSIRLGGPNGTDITDTTQSVVVGQQIALYADNNSTGDVTDQSWSIQGTIVAGYTASSSGGSVNTNVSPNGQSVTFYWTSPATQQTVSYFMTDSNNDGATASVTFNISAPSPATPVVTLPTNGQLYVSTLTGCATDPGGQFLVFGSLSGSAGTFTAASGVNSYPTWSGPNTQPNANCH